MIQVKTFCSNNSEGLDKKINAWFQNNASLINLNSVKINYQVAWQQTIAVYSAMIIYSPL